MHSTLYSSTMAYGSPAPAESTYSGAAAARLLHWSIASAPSTHNLTRSSTPANEARKVTTAAVCVGTTNPRQRTENGAASRRARELRVSSGM
jgi:hypothetical protein